MKMKLIVLFIVTLFLSGCTEHIETNDETYLNDIRGNALVIYNTDVFKLFQYEYEYILDSSYPVSLQDNTSDLYYFESKEKYESYYVEYLGEDISLNIAIRLNLFTSEDLIEWGITGISKTSDKPFYDELELTYIYYSDEFRIYKYHSMIATCDFGGRFTQGEKSFSLSMKPSSESRTYLFEKDNEFITLQEALNQDLLDIDNFKYFGINRLDSRNIFSILIEENFFSILEFDLENFELNSIIVKELNNEIMYPPQWDTLEHIDLELDDILDDITAILNTPVGDKNLCTESMCRLLYAQGPINIEFAKGERTVLIELYENHINIKTYLEGEFESVMYNIDTPIEKITGLYDTIYEKYTEIND